MEKNLKLTSENKKLKNRIAELEKELANSNKTNIILIKNKRKTEYKYKTLFESINDAIFVQPLLKEGFANFLEVNEVACKRLGYTRDELLNLSPKEISIAKDVHLRGKAEGREKLFNEKRMIFEATHITKTGKEIPVEISSHICELEGKPAVISLARDITNRKKAEADLKKSEYKYRMLANHTYDWEYWSDNKGNYIYTSPSSKRLTGYSSEEFIANPKLLFELVKPEYLDMVKKHYNYKNKEDTPVFTIEFPIITKNGEEKWIEHNCSPVFDENGKYAGRRGNNRDITDHKLAEEKLHTNEQRLKEAQKIAKLGSWEWDLISDEVVWSDETYTIYGIDINEKVTPNLQMELTYIDDKPLIEKLFKSIFGKEILPSVEYRIMLRNGDVKSIRGLAQRLFDNNGNVIKIFGTVQDITEQKAKDSRLRKSEYILNETQSISKIGGWEYKISDGRVIWTDEVFNIYGIPKGKIPVAEEGIKFYHKDYVEVVNNAFNKCIETGEEYDLEVRFINAKGKNMWIRTSGKPIYVDGKIYKLVGSYADITERKEVELKLKENEEKFSKAFFNHPDAMLLMNVKTGERIDVNESYIKILGYSKEEFLKTNAFESTLWVNPEYVKNNIKKLIKDRVILNSKVDVVTKSGEIRNLLGTASMLDVGDGNLAIISFVDITEKLKSEEDLKRSNERFSRLSSLSYEGIVIHKKGVVFDANKAFEEITGISIESIIGKNIISLIGSKENQEIIRSNMQKENPVPYEIEAIRKDGKKINLEIESKNINFDNEKEDFGVTAVRDITKRKKSELEILKLTNAIKQSPVSIVITNTDGKIEYVNPKFIEVTGYTFKEALNENPRILKSGLQEDKFYKELWNTISSGNDWRGEFHNKKKNGVLFWESAIISPVKDKTGKITNYIAVKEDITEKKKMLDEMILSKEYAENANRMKSVFLAQMSHEIRTPINAMLGMVSLLKYDFEEHATHEQLVSFDILDRSGERIIRTVDLLLNLSEVQTNTYEIVIESIDIFSSILSQIVAKNRTLAQKKGINLIINSNTLETELYVDAYTVNQIFVQLIENAIKYTEQGTVKIKIGRNESHQLVVEIIDTGVGIATEYLSQLFEPFSQEDMGYTRKFDGNGIGLTLVKEYCKLNNAIVEVESKKDVGSTFRVTFQF